MENVQINLNRWLLLLLFSITAVLPAMAQDKEAGKEQQIEAMLQNKNFVFKATSAIPLRGRTVQLTSEYDLRLANDTLRAFLPYFGRAYSAPYASTDGGIKLTTTDYTYTISNKKKKRWNITITPKDASAVQQFNLSVTKSGYATLQVLNTNRDAITFNGYIVIEE